MNELLVLCGGAGRSGEDAALRLFTSGPARNIALELEHISKKLIKKVPDLLADFIEIAAYVYCADRATSRGGPAMRAMGADWRRNFHFVIAVRDPNNWNHSQILEPLRETLRFLSEDE